MQQMRKPRHRVAKRQISAGPVTVRKLSDLAENPLPKRKVAAKPACQCIPGYSVDVMCDQHYGDELVATVGKVKMTMPSQDHLRPLPIPTPAIPRSEMFQHPYASAGRKVKAARMGNTRRNSK